MAKALCALKSALGIRTSSKGIWPWRWVLYHQV